MMLRDRQFEWSPLAIGLWRGFVCATPVVGFLVPDYAVYYLIGLLFCTFGLRPFLQRSGLHVYVSNRLGRLEEIRWQEKTDQRRREVETAAEVKRIKSTHVRDKRLPKNW